MKKAIKSAFCVKIMFIAVFCIFSLSICAFAGDYYVKTPASGGNDGNSGLTWASAKATIGAAMALVDGGDTIHVAAGTYNEKVTFHGSDNNQLLGGYPAGGEGTQDPWTHATIIDGTALSSGPMISIPGNGGYDGYSGMVIDGFTIQNGTHTSYGCAGIESYSLGVSITRNIIENNQATGTYGLAGGIYIMGQLDDNGAPVIEENIIRNNSAAGIGGIYLEGAAGKADNYVAYVVNNLIAGNASTDTGNFSWGVGGVDVVYPASASVVNCTIADNTAAHPTVAVAGVHVSGYSSSEKGILAMANCIIWHPSGDDIYVGSDGTFWMAYCDVEDSGDAGGTVISQTPDFVGGSDYHLTQDSPCIDAGTNQGTVITSSITNVPSLGNIVWGDGTHDLHNKWQYLTTGMGVAFGHSHATYPSDSDVEKVSPPLDITMYDASGLSYHDLSVTFVNGQYIFFQGLNGYYGAWRVDSVSSFQLLNGQSYFQCNGSANFDPGIRDNDLEGNARAFEAGICNMGAYEYIPEEKKGTIAHFLMLLLD